MELKDTVKFMESKDYNDHFIAEWMQLKIRYEKLKSILERWDKGELNFVPKCSRYLLGKQLEVMKDYLGLLEIRSVIEKVEIEG